MPKKTKKEKIIAQYHRRLQIAKIPEAHSIYRLEPLPANQFSPNVTTYPATGKHFQVGLPPQEFQAIRKDLVKTILIACLVFIGEGVVIYLMR